MAKTYYRVVALAGEDAPHTYAEFLLDVDLAFDTRNALAEGQPERGWTVQTSNVEWQSLEAPEKV